MITFNGKEYCCKADIVAEKGWNPEYAKYKLDGYEEDCSNDCGVEDGNKSAAPVQEQEEVQQKQEKGLEKRVTKELKVDNRKTK